LNDLKKESWYYVVVQNPETPQEQFLGYRDKTLDAVFIPAFKTKEIAQQCFLLMPKDVMNEKYEVQAIIREDLIDQARKNGYEVFLMDDKGTVLEKLF